MGANFILAILHAGTFLDVIFGGGLGIFAAVILIYFRISNFCFC